jgi:hypothetical protein
MITNTGKNIVAKYLIGQAPAYASYIAIGCGAKPILSDAPLGDYSDKTSLDFEMFRVPIISRGYVNEGGVSKVVFTAELPTEERYEITEVGVLSAGFNSAAGAYDSKSVYSFTQSENWEHHTASASTSIPSVYEKLDTEEDPNVISGEYLIGGVLTETPVFQTNADNVIFTNSEREQRYERCRFLNNIVMMSGDDSNISLDSGHLKVNSGNHIHLTGADVNFSKNSPTDELRLAFSVVNKDGESLSVPDNVKILLEFGSSDFYDAGSYARFEVNLDNGTLAGQHDFSTNRYVVVSKRLEDLYKTSDFTWNTVDVVKVYVCVTDNGAPSDQYYVALDALRLENVSTVNALYGLTGYSVVRTTAAKPIVKSSNTSNFVEFRFAIGVQ